MTPPTTPDRLSDVVFSLREGASLLRRRTPFRKRPADQGHRNTALPAFGETVTVDGIEMRIDQRMSPFNIRKLIAARHTVHERTLLAQYLRDDDRVLELGGGIGMVAIACAKRLGPGRVTSYEGNPDLESLIRDNYALNDVSPDLHMAILGRETGTTTFHIYTRFSHSRLGDGEGAERSVDVPVVPYRAALHAARPSVLVADIQGGETDLFAHADLTSLRMVLVELHPPLIGLSGMLSVRRNLRAAGLKEAGRHGTSFVYLRPDH